MLSRALSRGHATVCQTLDHGATDHEERGATVGVREDVRIIRPAAILDERAAAHVLQQLRRLDVSAGGIWNATSSLWQRYDIPWDGIGGTRGEAKLLGSIAVMYDSPHRHEITIYKVTISVFEKE